MSSSGWRRSHSTCWWTCAIAGTVRSARLPSSQGPAPTPRKSRPRPGLADRLRGLFEAGQRAIPAPPLPVGRRRTSHPPARTSSPMPEPQETERPHAPPAASRPRRASLGCRRPLCRRSSPKLTGTSLGEVEVREGDWRIRVRRPISGGAVAAPRRSERPRLGAAPPRTPSTRPRQARPRRRTRRGSPRPPVGRSPRPPSAHSAPWCRRPGRGVRAGRPDRGRRPARASRRTSRPRSTASLVEVLAETGRGRRVRRGGRDVVEAGARAGARRPTRRRPATGPGGET